MADLNMYYPEEQINRQYRLADALRQQPQGGGSSWAGIIGNGLRAVGGNFIQGDANNALQSNQALRTQSIQNVSNANDAPSLSKALLGSPVPEIQDMGLKTHIQQVSDDPNKDYRVRAAQASQYGLSPGMPEFRSFVLTGKLPDPLDTEYKRAQIGKLNAEAANGGAAYGKAGTIVQGPDGSFYSIQFGSGGQRKIEKLELGAGASGAGVAPAGVGGDGEPVQPSAPIPLTPSRGVKVEGDLMYDAATGKPVRNVGSNIAEGERQKIIGRETGEGQMNLPKLEIALKQYEAQDEIVNSNIDKAIEQASGWTTGFMGSSTSAIPGTPAHDLYNTLNTIKSNLGFDKLQAMRDASPTGGALGQVSEMENTLLQSVNGSLAQSQTKEQFIDNLNKIKTIRAQFRVFKRQAYEQDVARFGKANVPDPETGKLPGQQQTPSTPAAPAQSRPRAVNPQTGQTLEFDGQNWIEVR